MIGPNVPSSEARYFFLGLPLPAAGFAGAAAFLPLAAFGLLAAFAGFAADLAGADFWVLAIVGSIYKLRALPSATHFTSNAIWPLAEISSQGS